MSYQKSFLTGMLNRMNVVFGATVIDTNSDNTATISPNYVTGSVKPFEPLQAVPILNMGGKVNIPYKKGDQVICISMKKSIREVAGEPSVDASNTIPYNIANAVIIGSISQHVEDGTGLVFRNGNNFIEVKDDLIKLQVGATSITINADSVNIT